MNQGKIMTIHCATCGAPAQFDVVTQNYHCPNCGGNTGTEIPLKKLREFRSLTKTLLEQELPDSQTIACECPNCGARVIVKEHEVAETCIFCQSKVLRSDVQMGEGFPEMLIPFKLNRKQAEKRLDEWIEQHHDKSEAQILKENKKKLKGIYLPYELIRGPIRFVVTRDNSNRHYECGGFLEHVAVNVTDRCNNLLLNGMEPFLWDELEPFQFGYIAGHAAEIPTADGAELRRRVFEEVAEEYRPTVEHTMQTTGLALCPESEALLRLPAFLPVYFMDCGEVQAAVNGQTGKVSVLQCISWLVFVPGCVYFCMFQLAVYNNKTLNLNAKMTGRQNVGTGLQNLISAGAFGVPLLLMFGLKVTVGKEATPWVLIGIGLVFILTSRWWLRNVYHRFMKRRYKNMEGFHDSRQK